LGFKGLGFKGFKGLGFKGLRVWGLRGLRVWGIKGLGFKGLGFNVATMELSHGKIHLGLVMGCGRLMTPSLGNPLVTQLM
jgi:hypothetical protein